jgi:hypothetical protein
MPAACWNIAGSRGFSMRSTAWNTPATRPSRGPRPSRPCSRRRARPEARRDVRGRSPQPRRAARDGDAHGACGAGLPEPADHIHHHTDDLTDFLGRLPADRGRTECRVVAPGPRPIFCVMTEIEDIDVFVSGGGVAGLTATIAFAEAGFRTVCADPAPPITERDEGADLRTTAFLQPVTGVSRPDRHLGAAGAPRHAASGHAHRGCRRRGAEPRVAHDFNAADISDKPFGWNLPNWLLRREMVAHLAMPMADFRPGIGTAQAADTGDGGARDAQRRGAPARAAGDRGGRAQLRRARGGGHRRAHHALRAEGAGLRRDPSDPARECLDRDPPLRRAVHAGPPARLHRRGRDRAPLLAIVWMERGRRCGGSWRSTRRSSRPR